MGGTRDDRADRDHDLATADSMGRAVVPDLDDAAFDDLGRRRDRRPRRPSRAPRRATCRPAPRRRRGRLIIQSRRSDASAPRPGRGVRVVARGANRGATSTGTQPMCGQLPPNQRRSTIATLAPRWRASNAADSPAGPAPMITKSNESKVPPMGSPSVSGRQADCAERRRSPAGAGATPRRAGPPRRRRR